MIYEQIYFRRFGKDISNNINLKVNNSLISDSIAHKEVKNDILFENNNSSKLFNYISYDLTINNYYLNKSNNLLPNENINNSSYNISKKGINFPLLLVKNIYNMNNYFIKKEENLTEILIGLKLDEKIN